MKKVLLIGLIVLFVVLCFCSCDFNQRLRNRMLEHYGNDEYYIETSGIITNIDYEEKRITIRGTNPEDEVLMGREFVFGLCSDEKILSNLFVGDEIDFMTTYFDFYNGDISRLAMIEKDGVEYLSFEQGKQDLLDWINEYFKPTNQ